MEKRRRQIIAGMNYLQGDGKAPQWGIDPSSVKTDATTPAEKNRNKKSGKKNKKKKR